MEKFQKLEHLDQEAMPARRARTYILHVGPLPDARQSAAESDLQKRPEIRLIVRGNTVQIVMRVQEQLILQGLWPVKLRWNDPSLASESEWELLGRCRRPEAQYLEIEQKLPPFGRVNRQIIFVPRDQLVLITEAIYRDHGDSAWAEPLEHSVSLPLAGGVRWEGNGEPAEGFLVSGRRLARVAALSVPEWCPRGFSGPFAAEPGWLRHDCQSRSPRWQLSFVFDLSPRRWRFPCVCRRLTVTEQKVVQPPEAAVAYRWQIGRAQWVYYRSLAKPAGRAFFGQHLRSETFLGRVDYDKGCQLILEVT